LTITPTDAGSGSGAVGFTTTENNTGAIRAGTITVNGQKICTFHAMGANGAIIRVSLVTTFHYELYTYVNLERLDYWREI